MGWRRAGRKARSSALDGSAREGARRNVTEGPALPPPGWYPDPDGSGDRWWNGQRWAERNRSPSLSSDWRAWLAQSSRVETIDRFVAYAAASCAIGALLVSLAALVRDEPLEGASILLLPAIPILAVGQLWTIASMNARMPRRTGGWRDRTRASHAMSRNPRTFFFGDLPSRFARPLLLLAFLGWLSAMTAFPALTNGRPAGAGDGCQYRLNSHGWYTCVSRRRYEHAGAAEQRLGSGVMLAFFALHAGAALGGLHRRRQTR